MASKFSILFLSSLVHALILQSVAIAADPISVALLLAPSGKGDRSYNDMALEGARSVQSKFPHKLTDVLPARPDYYESVIRDFADEGSKLIVGVGFTYTEAFAQVAPQYPDTKFVLIDGSAGSLSNVRSIEFRPEEGSFLVGFVAARKSSTHKVGFVGGMDIPIIRRFACGYEAGVQFAVERGAPATTVQAAYLGNTPEGFGNIPKGRDSAAVMYSSGVDVIYHAAGKSGNGVIQAAKDARQYVIGVDSDQSWLAPDNVLTSMRKRIDRVVASAIEDVWAERFSGGVVSLGLREGYLDWVLPPNQSSLISPALVLEVSSLTPDIVDGAVKKCR